MEAARSCKTVVPTTLLVFSSLFYRPKGRDRSRVAPFCPSVATTNNSGSSGMPYLNRSGSASVLTALARERAQVASPPPTPGTLRSHPARQHHCTIDHRQEFRHLSARIHSNSINNTSTTMPARHTRDQENEERRPRTAPKGTKHQPQLRPAAACRPARLPCDPPTRAAPPQRHGRRRMTAARTAAAAQERRRAPDAMLRRQLSHEPYPSAPPPCARVPSGRHAQPSAESADGSQLAPAPPPTRGAAAPPSLVLPVISAVISTARGT